MTDAEKEQVKLRANYLNGLALALAAAGGIGPATLMIYRFEPKWVAVGVILLITGLRSSWDLHQTAMRHLEKLDGSPSTERET